MFMVENGRESTTLFPFEHYLSPSDQDPDLLYSFIISYIRNTAKIAKTVSVLFTFVFLVLGT